MSRLLFYCRVKNNYIQSAVHYASEEIHTPKLLSFQYLKKTEELKNIYLMKICQEIKVLFNTPTLKWAIYDEKNWYTEVYLFVTKGSDDKSLISRRRWDLDQAGATMLKKRRKSVFTWIMHSLFISPVLMFYDRIIKSCTDLQNSVGNCYRVLGENSAKT